MSKPKSGKSSYTSKGIHSNVSNVTLRDMKQARYKGDKLLNIFAAYLKGKNPWITIENPNKAETNKRFIKVRTNDHYGNPKNRIGGNI